MYINLLKNLTDYSFYIIFWSNETTVGSATPYKNANVLMILSKLIIYELGLWLFP